MVQFPDDLGGDTIIEKTFRGPLHQQLREALQFIQNSIIQERVVKLPDVAEAKRFFNYPFAAIEEALSNAVYHKGYDVREPIEVRVLPDRIEIVSHPGADRSITDEGLKTYHVFNYRELSPKMAATLCFGLRDESRVKMKLARAKITLTQTLIARMVDELSFQSWAKTKDGQKSPWKIF